VKSLTLHTTTEERPKISLKRKVGYVDEQVSATRARLADMQIDEEINKLTTSEINEID
jgi:hypothetical protein